EGAEAPRARRLYGGNFDFPEIRRSWPPELNPLLVTFLVESVGFQLVDVAPAEPACNTATEPTTTVGPVLGEHVAEDALGLTTHVVTHRRRDLGPVDAE